jgi:hypothetical protein
MADGDQGREGGVMIKNNKKYFFWFLLILSQSFIFPAFAHSNALYYAGEERVVINPKEIWMPARFSPNETMTITMLLQLRDSCHRADRAEVKVDLLQRRIFITQYEFYNKSSLCLFIFTTLENSIDLQPLEPGQYTVYTENTDGGFDLRGDFFVDEFIDK